MPNIPSDLTYIHIPKTGGTALKFLRHLQQKLPFHTPGTHNVRLINTKTMVWFVVRDPLERFCSGFWERATTPERQDHAQQRKGLPTFGYSVYKPVESQVFESCKTPNDFLDSLRLGVWGDQEFQMNSGLGCMIAPLTHWLGNLETLRSAESRIWAAVDIKVLSDWVLEVTGNHMPEDPFLRRSRALFERKQSYEISQENQAWFQIWRAEDYRLIDHMVQQPYYRSSAN